MLKIVESYTHIGFMLRIGTNLTACFWTSFSKFNPETGSDRSETKNGFLSPFVLPKERI
jgi:hypothetical protein